MTYRSGTGIDFHQLAPGRELWIGGVQIPHHLGAVGHSDADVLLHAVCDAMLGALALGDIGKHFPDTDNRYKGIDSKILLAETLSLIQANGYQPVNVDATLVLQSPKIAPYISAMQQGMADILRLPINAVSIKATTPEKMGFAGREEGLFAYASALLMKPDTIEVPVMQRTVNALPTYATVGAAGMDLRASLDVTLTLQPMQRALIPTGLYFEIPAGYEAQIRPRSGLALKQGITCLNTPGTIDSDYRGEVKVMLINLGQEPFAIDNNDRIAQIIFAPVTKVTWKSVETLNETNRGTGGFGHSGTQ